MLKGARSSTTVSISDVSNSQWDQWAQDLNDGGIIHSAAMLRFLDALNPEGAGGLSFAVFDGSGLLVGLCPFGIHTTQLAGRHLVEASFCGDPLGLPLLRQAEPGERRRLARIVYSSLDETCRHHGVGRAVLRRPAISRRTVLDHAPVYALEALDFGYLCHMRSVLCVDLRRSEADLFASMKKEHRKQIRKTTRQNVNVDAFEGESAERDRERIMSLFAQYRHAHFISAGRNTRPEETWDLMLQYLFEDMATLFVAFHETVPISFLYSANHGDLALGWSQVNVEEYEDVYSPRHLLEWQAMLHYQTRGLAYYEIGTRFKSPDLYHVPTEKEITISNFKERYCGQPWPEYVFEKFYDMDLQDQVLCGRYRELRTAQNAVLGESP